MKFWSEPTCTISTVVGSDVGSGSVSDVSVSVRR